MILYTVQAGDTLYQLAQRYGVPLSQLQADNQLQWPERLVPGQALLIDTAGRTIQVQQGQTLFGLAQQLGTTVEQLLQYNPDAASGLRVGQLLQLPEANGLPFYGDMEVNGYARPTIAMEILDKTLPYLSDLSVFSYSILENGQLVPIADEPLVEAARAQGTLPIMVLTNIRSGSNFDSDIIHRVLVDQQIQERLIENILLTAQSKGYGGVDLDLEYIYPKDTEAYNRFLKHMEERLHSAGLMLFTAVAPKTSANQKGLLYEAHDYAAHGRYADRVTLMTYEWGYRYGEPQAVAPLDKVEQVVRYAVQEIPAGKLLMGIPNYAYDWTLPHRQGDAAEILTNAAAVDRAAEYWAEIQFDDAAQTPYYYYTDAKGHRHVVWFEDARSIRAKLELAQRYGLAGVSYWNVDRWFSQAMLVQGAMFDIVKGQ